MKQVRPFFVLVFVTMIATALIRPAVPLILRNSGANGFQIGLVAALFMAFRAISASFNGYMWDRNKIPSFIIPLSFFLMSLLFYGYYFFATFAGFLLIRALQGALPGTFWPILQLETLKRSGKDSSKALSLYYIFGNIGGVVGILLSAPMILLLTRISKSPSENDALPLLFIIGGSIILFLALTSFKLKVNGNKKETEKEEEERRSKDLPRYIFVFILIFSFLAGSISNVLNSLIIVYIKENFSLNTVNTTLVYGGLVLISSLFIWVFNFKISADKWKKPTGSVLVLLSLSLMAFIFNLGYAGALFFLLLVFIGIKAIVPLSRNLSFVLFTGNPGTRIGLLNSVSNVGSFIGPLVAGFIYDNSSNKLLSFPITGILFIITAVVLFICINVDKKEGHNC